MRAIVYTVVATGLCLFATGSWVSGQSGASTPAVPPPWAYPVPTPGTAAAAPPPAADDGAPKRVPGSSVGLTLTQIRDVSNVPDWHPDDHPPMPDIVVHGRKPDVRFGCGYCHYPNGRGRPENASLAGLPAAYIVQQMADYKNGLRRSAEPKMGPPSLMLQLAKNVTDDEVKAAAAYFSALKWTTWVKVVEAATVPKSRMAGGMFIPLEAGGTEPIGQRILEMPQDWGRTELRDSQSPFIAYVPPGSINRGEALATKGSGRTTACGVCHGADLKGLGPVPGLAGRSPSYTVRQLFDMQHGARSGPWAELMKPVVAKLSMDDLIDLAAYTASLTP
jgi:cytochrome c553